MIIDHGFVTDICEHSTINRDYGCSRRTADLNADPAKHQAPWKSSTRHDATTSQNYVAQGINFTLRAAISVGSRRAVQSAGRFSHPISHR
jgi:hypothetical protein